MMVWSASGSLVIYKMSGCPPRPVSPHHCPGHRGNIGCLVTSVWQIHHGGMLARLGEWGLGWEHEETLSTSDIMTGSTKHHGYKVRLTSSAPCHIVTQLLCKQQTTVIICQNQTFLLLGQNNAQPTNIIFGFNFNLSMDKESVECRWLDT